ncbi:uncharacterized protein EV420DRAFT_118897 [Desarmillaria tabescens]|uniref:Uncharacterized protein n=1 Tax=Armillaria tabescens TaxID=1929756 RepID=A0AA39N9R9_ARMTA|nr:uncharacterized protein EV420DRAFT_118897 [Desarmillaria tabescens]KAK0461618.1 hypothetical protein EV420DRAFT_118897 [Desarmillaria tabescens]
MSSARSSRGVSRSSRPEICSTMTSDGMDGSDTESSPLPCVTPPLQRLRRITMHRSAPSSPFYDGQNPAFGLNNFSNHRVPHARPSLQRQRRITLHGDSTSPFSSNDLSWPQLSHFLPNDAGYSSMPAPPSLFAESFPPSIPSGSAFSSGSEYSAPDASLLSPPSMMQMPFPSIPQTSTVDVYDPTSSSMRSYSSHDPSLTMEMGQYCGSLASTPPNQSISSPDNPWGIPAGSFSVMSSPNNPSLINPSDIATRQPTQGTRNITEYDQLFLHDPRNTYSAGVNQVNYDIPPYAGSPFSSSSYTSENYTPYQMLLDYNPIPQTAPSLRYSPGPQNALQLEFSTATTDLPTADVSETGPLDPELLLMDFYVPQNTNEQ